ncbi:MAG: hypothetical protein OXC02_03340 [Rhodobacteraceae bacterium]|nr:hypothetical protein [Paracoccaceae bacterium]
MIDSKVTIYINTGTQRLPLTCSEDDVQSLMMATKKFQLELDIVDQLYPNDSATNKVLLTGVRIADAINLIEQDPKLYHAEINRLKELTEKMERLAQNLEIDP